MVKLRIIHVLSFAGLVGSSLVMIGLLIYAARLNPVASNRNPIILVFGPGRTKLCSLQKM